MLTLDTLPPAHLCPLCNQSNQCARLQDTNAIDCWCMRVRVSPAALAAVPGQERGQRCICAHCATAGIAPTEQL